MMLAQVHFPSSPIDPEELDAYLANGWFRMGQTIFTTHILHYNHHFYSAVWLRIPLHEPDQSKTFKKLQHLNAAFTTVVRPALVNAEKEALFEKYKTGISFEASSSVENLLFGKDPLLSVYDTYEVAVYDQERLIAVGFFDLGKESAAGISSFYDPEYKKNSLGKYLIYLKIEYCRQKELRYFYPGYFVPGYSLFDYKLHLAKNSIQYYSLHGKEWLSIDAFSVSEAPLEKMQLKLAELSERMTSYKLPSVLFHYEFYNANLTPELKGLELFDFPVFLYCFDALTDAVNPIVVYDVRDQQYHLVQCDSLVNTGAPLTEGENYAVHLLKIRKDLYVTSSADEMARQLSVAVEFASTGLNKKNNY